MDELKKEADRILEEIREASGKLAGVERQYQEHLEALQARYEVLWAPLKERVRAADKSIKSLMKKNAGRLFDGGDTVKLLNGLLLYNKEDKVQIPRDALGKIEALGWTEAVIVEKKVDRGVVEEWPEERLFEIGAKRKTKKTFGYETKEPR